MKLAIASDLHCHEIVGKSEPESFLTVGLSKTPRTTHPIEALKQRVRESGLTADLLLCPGDLANRCSVAGLTAAWESVQELGDALNVREIVATLGNHDVDSRRSSGTDPFAPAKALPAPFPINDRRLADEYWAKHYCILTDYGVRMLIIDSVASHTNEAEAKHGLITDTTLEALEDSLRALDRSTLGIAMVHHHPHAHEDIDLGAADLMYGGQKLLTLLTSYDFSLVVHGHKHHPKLSYAQGGATTPCVFAVGSLTHINHAHLASNTRNLFHIVDVSATSLPGCSVAGNVRSWEFNWLSGWNPATVRSSGFPSLAGFGCRLPPSELVDRILPLIAPTAEWQSLQSIVPQLPYMLPQDQSRLVLLLGQAGVRISRDDVGEPYLLLRQT